MRSFLVVVAWSLFAGCGHKATTPPKDPSIDEVTSQKVAPAATRSADVMPVVHAAEQAVVPIDPPSGGMRVGHLEGRDHLGHLFEALARLESDHSGDDVRIVQFGDSHTASDLGTAAFRRAMQARFGDGGRGFVSLGRPWKTYTQEGVRGGMTDGFEPVRVTFRSGAFYGLDGRFGLLGVGIGASKAGEGAWTDVVAHTTRVELDYGEAPVGGTFDVFIDGARAKRIATRAEQPSSGYCSFDVTDAPHRVELRTIGDGDVRVFGMTLDRAQAGVVVDALGINGAQIFTPLRWNEEHFVEQLRHRAPDLVVIAYGTNESLESRLPDTEYERGVVDFLGRIARATPAAACLLLAPPDRAMRATGQDAWATAPRIVEITEIQRRVAAAAGCAFYDQLEAMGGPGSISAWAIEAEPRAARDRVHLTRSGYAQLGTAFAGDVLQAYERWGAERRMQPSPTPKTWSAATR
ncbi:MAG: GDSL-type esterase/lipase family protein [Myxococcota bacterium]|nr:GDSL-type esterase/lipase family protein [Myxococcota bacterium]